MMTDEDIKKAKAEMPITIDAREADARKKIAMDFLALATPGEPYLSNALRRLAMWSDFEYRGQP